MAGVLFILAIVSVSRHVRLSLNSCSSLQLGTHMAGSLHLQSCSFTLKIVQTNAAVQFLFLICTYYLGPELENETYFIILKMA